MNLLQGTVVVMVYLVRGLGAQQYLISTVAGGSPPPTPVLATSASIGEPQSAVVDGRGNLYFSAGNCVFELDAKGQMTLVAGDGRVGYAGDGGPARNAQLSYPKGLAMDSRGNLLVADSLNNRIRMVSTEGIISTVAGGGTDGLGDGGPATRAQLSSPTGVAVDGQGNIYIADWGKHLVRKVSVSGIISTAAGSEPGYSGDGGLATSARLTYPYTVVVDAHSNVFIADSQNSRIRKVAPDGTITTVAGTGLRGYSGDGGPATSAALTYPKGVSADAQGNLYITDYNCVRKVSACGIITTVAGATRSGYSGDGGPASSALLNDPLPVAIDVEGSLYIPDRLNYRLRKVSAGGSIATVAGNGAASYSGDGGAAADAQFNGPWDVTVDAQGSLFVSDSGNHRIRKVSTNGTVTTVAGDGTAGFSGDGGPALSAQLNFPRGLAVDARGNLFIADYANRRVRKVAPDGTITTVAGTGALGYDGDGGQATKAALQPFFLALDQFGTLYFSDPSGPVRKVTQDGIISTVALLDSSPLGVAADGQGNLFIVDNEHYGIVKVSIGGAITTVAGTGKEGYSGDGGPATSAELSYPLSGLAIDRFGNLFIADQYNRRVRKVSPSGTITTVAGNGVYGHSGDGGAAAGAQIFTPQGLAADAQGNVYLVDSDQNAVRRLQPANHSVLLGAVVDAASQTVGPVSPGKIVVLYGAGLGPATLTQNAQVNGVYPNQLAGTTVAFNGIAAPVLYTSAAQVAAIVPYGITGPSTQVTVSYQSDISPPVTMQVAAAAPGLFTQNQTGAGQAAAVNAADGSVNTAANPVKQGGYISLFATGEGQTVPPGIDGKTASLDPLPQPAQKVSVTVAGIPAIVQYAGAAPNQVAGLIQVNVRIPDAVEPGGYVPVVLQVGNASTVAGAAWIAVAAK